MKVKAQAKGWRVHVSQYSIVAKACRLPDSFLFRESSVEGEKYSSRRILKNLKKNLRKLVEQDLFEFWKAVNPAEHAGTESIEL